jgi:uncharacterized RDD family membrane protein YckC
MMTITCPHCGFAREIDPGRIPPGVTEATCPRCKQSFSLSEERSASADFTPAPPVAPSQLDLPRAGFWIRAAAFLLDSAAVTVLQFAIGFLLALVVQAIISPDTGVIEFVVRLFGTVLAITYYVFFTGYCGQTPGKMVLKLKVIRTDGGDVSYGRAALREVLGKFLSGIILGIGYFMVAFTKEKQGLHDKIADTYVVKLQ